LTLPDKHSRFQLPSSLRLLLSPGVRGHTLIYTLITGFLFITAFLRVILSPGQAWTIIFTVGASTAGTYLTLSLLSLSEKFQRIIFHSRMKTRMILIGLIFVPVLGGILYWIGQAGSVEALPIFPAFIVIFYGWILLQAYFIATPVTHLLTGVEKSISGEGHARKFMRLLGSTVLFLPVIPLVYGVWAISSWLGSTYQNVQGASEKIIAWTLVVAVLLVATYMLTVLWGWKTIRQGAPQAAVFVGGTFLVLWGYLLYRAATLAIGYITQSQPANPVLDAGLMIVSIIGAMQGFARKTLGKADRRWSQILPFLVFAFGSVYAVAQFYFILQFAVTRADLSILVNATVFATGIVTMIFLIRKHLLSFATTNVTPTTLQTPAQYVVETGVDAPSTGQPKHSLFRFPWKKKETTEEGLGEEQTRKAVPD
jgi:hypothetical protein